MPSHVLDSFIFRDLYNTPEMATIFDDRYLVQCWLNVEAALARAQARLGIVPTAVAEEISRQAVVDNIDFDELRAGTNLVGYPIVSLVRQLAGLCQEEAAGYVHWGATTQDIMDTGNVLQLREAINIIEQDIARLTDILTNVAATYRNTLMAGRTHGQQALPITFGFKVAVWIDELRRHAERFAQCRPRVLRCQFGGAAGTLASLGDKGWQVHQGLAQELNLHPAPIAWHTARDGFGEFVSLCGMLTATLGKMANEIAVLQKTEMGEASESFTPGKGSSSTMPQKRNPILCETVIGISKLVAQHVPTMLSAMTPEHERAMGEWHVEWDLLSHTSSLTGAALHHSIAIFDQLVVNASAMQENIDLTRGQIVAESVMMRLGEYMGRQKAHDIVYEACILAEQNGQSLHTVLTHTPEVNALLSEAELEALLAPANYVGLAPFFVDQITHASTEIAPHFNPASENRSYMEQYRR